MCDECVQRTRKPDPETGLKARLCPAAATTLRVMYLGAEWRRRTRTDPDNEETKGK